MPPKRHSEKDKNPIINFSVGLKQTTDYHDKTWLCKWKQDTTQLDA